MNHEDTTKAGGPAFPISIPGCGDNGWHGMTLRDYFAAACITGFFSDRSIGFFTEVQRRDLARSAYEIADSMLEARKS